MGGKEAEAQHVKFIWNNPVLKIRRQALRRNQTQAEKTLWRRIRARQLHEMKFFRQYSVGPFILDFYCPRLKLAREVDGGQHAYDENRKRDDERTEYLKRYSVDVLRFWNNDVLQNIEAVLEKISQEILARNSNIPNSP